MSTFTSLASLFSWLLCFSRKLCVGVGVDVVNDCDTVDVVDSDVSDVDNSAGVGVDPGCMSSSKCWLTLPKHLAVS